MQFATWCLAFPIVVFGNPHAVEVRAPQLPNTPALPPALDVPTNWTYVGCYSDTAYARTLSGATVVSPFMTGGTCIDYCAARGYPYAGTEYTTECFCGLSLGISKYQPGDCLMPCGGDPLQTCGGPNRLTVYANTHEPPPQTNPGLNGFTYQGCYTDDVYNRTLPRLAGIKGGAGLMTVAKCIEACFDNSYNFAGVEFSGECWCGSELLGGTTRIPGIPLATGCSSICQGNFSEFCGGPNRLDVYSFTDIEYIDNGDFEAGVYPWVTRGINQGYRVGTLRAAIQEAPSPALSNSSGHGLWNLYITDSEPVDEDALNPDNPQLNLTDTTNSTSICIGRVINLEKSGRYNFTAAVGRLSPPSSIDNTIPQPADDLQYQIVLRHYTPNGLQDYAEPAQPVCGPGSETRNCTAPAVSGELLYELVNNELPITPERAGWHIFYFCGIFNGEEASLHTLVADNLSIRGRISSIRE